MKLSLWCHNCIVTICILMIYNTKIVYLSLTFGILNSSSWSPYSFLLVSLSILHYFASLNVVQGLFNWLWNGLDLIINFDIRYFYIVTLNVCKRVRFKKFNYTSTQWSLLHRSISTQKQMRRTTAIFKLGLRYDLWTTNLQSFLTGFCTVVSPLHVGFASYARVWWMKILQQEWKHCGSCPRGLLESTTN